MNSKEFLAVLAGKAGLSLEECSANVDSLVEIMVEHLCDGDSLSLQGFGVFEVKKKNERIIVNPSSHQKMLVPPKLAVGFKPASSLKERLK